MALNLSPRPGEAPDVITEGSLHGIHLGGAQSFVGFVRADHSSLPRRPPFWPPLPRGPWLGNGGRVSGATLIGALVDGEIAVLRWV